MKRKWLLVIGLVSALVLAGLGGCAYTPGEGISPSELKVSLGGQNEGIWVNGQGEVTAVPDIANLRLGIVAQEASVAEAQARAAEAMDKLITVLTDGGVAKKDIQTQYFNIQKVTRWDKEREREIVLGYRVSNMVLAKIRDIEKAGSIIDAVAKAGGDLVRIDGISFSIDDPSDYYEEARDKAMADARAKAEQLARLGGVKLGKPTYISEGISYPVPRPIYERAPAAAPVPAQVETPISPGEMKISLNVQVVYAISK